MWVDVGPKFGTGQNFGAGQNMALPTKVMSKIFVLDKTG